MKNLFIILFMLVITNTGMAQDALQNQYLKNVTIKGVKMEGDTLQNFFRANRSANTEEIMSRLMGVSLIRRSAYGQEPAIRGMSGGQINVTIDGMRMFGACTDKMDPVSIYIEPQNLKSIDASLGTNGSSLGSTIGGSLNLQLAEPRLNRRGLTTRAGTGYQSVSNGFNFYSDLEYGLGNSAYRANLVYRKNDNYRNGNRETVQFSQFEKLNLSLSAKWKISKDTLRADVLIDEGRDIGYPALPMDVGKASARIYAITYLRHLSAGVIQNLKLKAYANQVYHSMDDTHREVEMHMDMPGWSNTFGAFAEGTFKSMGKHRLQARLDFYFNNTKAEMVMRPEIGQPMYMQTWPASNRSVIGIYMQDELKISAHNTLQFNGRVDLTQTNLESGFGTNELEVFYASLPSFYYDLLGSFNATITHRTGRHLQFSLHTGYGERLPTNSEMFGFYLFNRQDGYDYIGNPILKKERSLNSDVTAKYYASRLEIQATYFYQFNPDYIIGFTEPILDVMTPGARGVKVYQNTPYSVFQGTELSLLMSMTKKVQLVNTTKVTYAQANTGASLPFIPPLKNLSTLRYFKKGFNAQIEWEVSARQQRVSESFGEMQTPSYSIFNIRGSYNWDKKLRYSLSAGIENVANEYYREHLDWGNIYRPGRNFYVNMEIRL